MNDSHITDHVKALVAGIPRRLALLKGERSQRKWAEQLRVPQPVICRYLQGSTPEITFLVHLAREENVSLDWLMMGVGEAYREK